MPELRFWSVPVVSETSSRFMERGQQMQRTTTTYNIGGRRHHETQIKWLSPGVLARFIGMLLGYSVFMYMMTFGIPGIILSITKDESLAWIFGVWAGGVVVVAAFVTRYELHKKLMLRHARRERGLARNAKLAIVPDAKWDRWVGRLQKAI